MGCSSSSAQTVDQEKRPGTKPEDSSRDTGAVKNGTIAEEAKTIEDQMQLPVQTTLKDDPKLISEEKAEDVMVAMEAQEDLGSGEDLLAVPEPHPEPAACQDPSLEPAATFSVGGSVKSEAAVAEEEVEPPAEEAAPVEMGLSEVPLVIEVPPVVEVLVDANKEAPATEPVDEVQTKVSDAAEEVVPEPAVEPEPAGTPIIQEDAQFEPVEDLAKPETPPVTAEEQAKDSAAETVSEPPTEVSDNAPCESLASDEALRPHDAPDPSVASVPNEASAPAEPSVPADAVSPVIDTAIAAATVPDIPSVSAAAALNETQPSSEEEVLTAPPTEAPCHLEVTSVPPAEAESAAEPVQNLEVPAPVPSLPETPLQAAADKAPVNVTSESAAEVSVVESISDQCEDPTAPEPSAEVTSANEVSQESEAAIKED